MSSFKIIDTGVEGTPDITIAMLAYNHGAYIEQAIESVLMQNATCSYEILVVEDCSTDNTRDIILKYKERYPQKFKLILQDKNVGGVPNSIVMLTHLSGRYVALLEGDDYWTNPYKLQKQFDFLEKNSDFSSCFHNVSVLKDGTLKEDDMLQVNDVTTIYDLAKNNYIRYCSYLFRNNLLKELPGNFHEVSAGDYFYFMLIAKYGKIKKMPEIMAVYRKHGGGIWSSNDSITRYKIMLRDLELMFPYFDDDVSKILMLHHAEIALQFATYIMINKSSNEAKDYLYKSMGTNLDTLLDRIVNLMEQNNILKSEKKNLKSNLKNFINIITKDKLRR